jgi:hypothetical protein
MAKWTWMNSFIVAAGLLSIVTLAVVKPTAQAELNLEEQVLISQTTCDPNVPSTCK